MSRDAWVGVFVSGKGGKAEAALMTFKEKKGRMKRRAKKRRCKREDRKGNSGQEAHNR